tara:strand:- start:1946 stop:2128 length:183 start_codon:yes stop_codon:yes gene_type:complete
MKKYLRTAFTSKRLERCKVFISKKKEEGDSRELFIEERTCILFGRPIFHVVWDLGPLKRK